MTAGAPLPAARQGELIARAQDLADGLARGRVTRAELRPVLNALFLPPRPWRERLATARRLLEALPESWVAQRSGKTRSQLARVRDTLRPVVREGASERELAFLLGWTARLLQVDAALGRPEDRVEEEQAGLRGAAAPGGAAPGGSTAVAAERRPAEAAAGWRQGTGEPAPRATLGDLRGLGPHATGQEPSAPARRPGMRITVEVRSAAEREFVLRDIETGQEIAFKWPAPLPWAEGARLKVKVDKVAPDGKVLKVRP